MARTGLLTPPPNELTVVSSNGGSAMNLSIGLRGDDAIIIDDEDDPGRGLVLLTIPDAEQLIAAVAAMIARVRANEAERRAAMRAMAVAIADDDLLTD